MTAARMPDPGLLRHFPEATLLAVLDAALLATELALREEHPTADELPLDPQHDVPASLVTAHLILTRAVELRDLLALYDAAVKRALAWRFDPFDHIS